MTVTTGEFEGCGPLWRARVVYNYAPRAYAKIDLASSSILTRGLKRRGRSDV